MGKIDKKKRYILFLSIALSLFVIAYFAVSAFAGQVSNLNVQKVLLDEYGNEVTDDDTVFDVEIRCSEVWDDIKESFGISAGETIGTYLEPGIHYDLREKVEELPEGYSLVDYNIECDYMSLKTIENNGEWEDYFGFSLEKGQVCTITITNEVKTEEEPEPNLVVEKILVDEEGEEVTDDDTVFDVEIRCGEGALAAEFGLKAGESKEVEGLYKGQTYFLEEVNLDELPEGYSWVDYEVKYEPPFPEVLRNSKIDNGPIEVIIESDRTCIVTITNEVKTEEEPEPNLVVEKILVDEEGEEVTDDDTVFDVEIRRGKGEEKVESFQLTGGESKSFDLEEGDYFLEEVNLDELPLGYSLVGYDVSYIYLKPYGVDNSEARAEFEIMKDQKARVVITNEVERPNLLVQKVLKDEEGEEVTDDDTVFDVEIRCGEGAVAAEFGLKAGESKEVEGLLKGQSYFLEEVNLDELPEGYSLKDYDVFYIPPFLDIMENSEAEDGTVEFVIWQDRTCIVTIINEVEIEEETPTRRPRRRTPPRDREDENDDVDVDPEPPEVDPDPVDPDPVVEEPEEPETEPEEEEEEPEEEVEVVEEVDPEEPEVDPDEELPRTGDARALWHFGFGGILMVIGALLMKKFSLNSQA